MKELELKYGCNPNQKPSQDFYEKRRRTAGQSSCPDDRAISIYWTL